MKNRDWSIELIDGAECIVKLHVSQLTNEILEEILEEAYVNKARYVAIDEGLREEGEDYILADRPPAEEYWPIKQKYENLGLTFVFTF